MLVQYQDEFAVSTRGQALIDITDKVNDVVRASAIATGQVTVFIQHTSASLLLQENASPDVRRDLLAFFTRLVPEGAEFMTHVDEGPDDMPAHIKSALTQVSLTIPIRDGSLALGTWQGLYLFEHRRAPHSRHVLCHVIGE